MKKDLSLALIVGLVIGGFLTFVLYKTVSFALRQKVTVSPSPQPSPVGSQPPTYPQLSDLTSLLLTNQQSYPLTVNLSPNQTVIITGEKEVQAHGTDDRGEMKVNLKLSLGMNSFILTTPTFEGLVSRYLYLFYSPKITDEQLNSSPKMGVIIDLAESALQINTYETKNNLPVTYFSLPTTQGITFFKAKKDTFSIIPETEIAIGDFAVVLDSTVYILSKPVEPVLNIKKVTVITATTRSLSVLGEEDSRPTELTLKNLTLFPPTFEPATNASAWLVGNTLLVAI